VLAVLADAFVELLALCCCMAISVIRIWPLSCGVALPVSALLAVLAAVGCEQELAKFVGLDGDDDADVVGSSAENSEESN
jgi:hypothetical protein